MRDTDYEPRDLQQATGAILSEHGRVKSQVKRSSFQRCTSEHVTLARTLSQALSQALNKSSWAPVSMSTANLSCKIQSNMICAR